MSSDLDPCPFCRSATLDEVFGPRGGERVVGLFAWFCLDCGARGPACESTDIAADAWNRRAESADDMDAIYGDLGKAAHTVLLALGMNGIWIPGSQENTPLRDAVTVLKRYATGWRP